MIGFVDCRRKQSFPAFWILGSIVGLGFCIMGGCIIYSFFGIDPAKRDGSMLFAGIGTILVGVLLLAGVIYTLKIMANPDDLSFKVDIHGKKKHDVNKLVHYIDIGHNNVLLFNSEEGQMRVFGSRNKFIVEVFVPSQDDYSTYHLTNPYVSDEAPVIVGNIFFERFPVRKNRIVNMDQAVKAIETFYSSQHIADMVSALPFINTTEETKRLVEKDAYIAPSVPFVIPKKQSDIDRSIKEKEEREARAMQELRSTCNQTQKA